MTCLQCGTEGFGKYCSACGAALCQLRTRCPQCGLDGLGAHCATCGTLLAPQPSDTKVSSQPVRVRRNIARTSKDKDILASLLSDSDTLVRSHLASNKNACSSTLRQLAEDRDSAVRAKVARNPNTSDDLLKRLAGDSSWFVRRTAATSINSPSYRKNQKIWKIVAFATIALVIFDGLMLIVPNFTSNQKSASTESLKQKPPLHEFLIIGGKATAGKGFWCFDSRRALDKATDAANVNDNIGYSAVLESDGLYVDRGTTVLEIGKNGFLSPQDKLRIESGSHYGASCWFNEDQHLFSKVSQ